jgi:ribosomal protein S18 acetylase RimI-like enzyme
MNIHLVRTRKDLGAFIDLPYQLYQDDPVWVPPLRREVRAQLNPRRNPMLDHCEWALILLQEDGKAYGRVAAFIDHLANEFWGERVGLFGYYECIPDPAAGRLLLRSARDWLMLRGMRRFRGPWSFVSQEWGSVVEGFTHSPVIMAPYNPPYYNDHYRNFGFQKAMDLLCWKMSIAEGDVLPERVINMTDKVASRYGVRTRTLNMKDYDAEVQKIVSLSNASLVDNWGYSPVTEAEALALAKDMKPIIQPEGVIFAEDESGESIGFAIALPDVNSLLKGLGGRLFPYGFIKLLWGMPRLRRYRLFGLGVVPAYQGKAVDSLLYRALYESLYTPQTEVEINYVLEDNVSMINAIRKLGAHPVRRYRVYEMAV